MSLFNIPLHPRRVVVSTPFQFKLRSVIDSTPCHWYLEEMSVDDEICVDAGQPATVNNGAGNLTDCRPLVEHVWANGRAGNAEAGNGRKKDEERATIK